MNPERTDTRGMCEDSGKNTTRAIGVPVIRGGNLHDGDVPPPGPPGQNHHESDVSVAVTRSASVEIQLRRAERATTQVERVERARKAARRSVEERPIPRVIGVTSFREVRHRWLRERRENRKCHTVYLCELCGNKRFADPVTADRHFGSRRHLYIKSLVQMDEYRQYQS